MQNRFPRAQSLLVSVSAALVVAFAPQGVEAATPIRTLLNGRELTFDVAPVIESDRTLVPLRGILEALGAKVSWDEPNQMTTAGLNGNEVKVVIGSNLAVVNRAIVMMDVPARIQSDRTLIPLRFFAENLGLRVGWDGAQRIISLQGQGSAVASRDSATVSRAGARLVEVARGQVGADYAWGGTSPDTGFDCSGFMLYVARQVGVELPRTSFEQFTAGIPVERANLIAGDLLFFTTYAPGASHAGIYDGNGNFVHAGSEGKGVSVTPLTNVYWSQRFLGARRIVR